MERKAREPLSSPARQWTILALTLTLGGLALAVWHLGRNSLWSDEIVTAQISRQPLAAVWRSLRGDPNDLPFYYLVQWAFSWLGNSEWAIRLPSAFAGALTVAAMYRLGSELGGQSAGVLAAGMVALHPYQLWAAQEARYYALVGLLATLSAAFLLALLRRPCRRYALAFAACTGAALLTHFFCVLMFAAELAFVLLLLVVKRQQGRLAGIWLLGLVALLLFALPSLPYAIRLLRTEAGGASPMLTSAALRGLWLSYGLSATALALVMTLLALAGLALMASQRGLAAALPILWFAVAAPLTVITSTHFFLGKYLHYLFPMFVALVATGLIGVLGWLSALARHLRIARSTTVHGLAGSRSSPTPYQFGPVAAGLALVILGEAGPAQAYYRSQKFDWRAATAYLASRVRPGDAVIMLPPAVPEMQWYYRPETAVTPPIGFGYGRQSLPPLLDASANARSVYWIVLIPSGWAPGEAALKPAFDDKAFYGVLVLRSRVPALEAASTLLPVFAQAAGLDAVLAGPAWDTQGAALEQLGRTDDAAQAYQRALAYYREPRVRSRLSGDLARLRGDWATAARDYETATHPAPDLAEVYLRLGQARQHEGDASGAVSAYLEYWHVSGQWPAGLCMQVDLLAITDEARVQTPSASIQTPYCRPGSASSCYVARSTFTLPSNGESRPVLFMHPPSSVTYSLVLPDAPVFLVSSPLLDPQSWGWGSDGVEFRVLVGSQGTMTEVGDAVVRPADRAWHDWLLPLSEWAGRRVDLRLETTPGPAGDATADWAGWGVPMLVGPCEGGS